MITAADLEQLRRALGSALQGPLAEWDRLLRQHMRGEFTSAQRTVELVTNLERQIEERKQEIGQLRARIELLEGVISARLASLG